MVKMGDLSPSRSIARQGWRVGARRAQLRPQPSAITGYGMRSPRAPRETKKECKRRALGRAKRMENYGLLHHRETSFLPCPQVGAPADKKGERSDYRCAEPEGREAEPEQGFSRAPRAP